MFHFVKHASNFFLRFSFLAIDELLNEFCCLFNIFFPLILQPPQRLFKLTKVIRVRIYGPLCQFNLLVEFFGLSLAVNKPLLVHGELKLRGHVCLYFYQLCLQVFLVNFA